MISFREILRPFVTTIFLAVAPLVEADCDFSDFPKMWGMKLHSVLDNSQHNNRPMMVKGFTVDSEVDEVVDFYHRKWKGRFDDSTIGPWYQVSTLTASCMMTVQIASMDDSAQGRLVISNVPTADPGAEIGEGLIAPSDAVVVSDLLTQDGIKDGRLSLLASADSPSEVSAFYQSAMSAAGWLSDHSFAEGDARVLVFRKGLNVMNVLIMPTPQVTQILINEETVR
jgi:hypothetical protein